MDTSSDYGDVAVHLSQESVRVKKKLKSIDVIKFNNLDIVIRGKYIKIAEIKEEWDQAVTDPELIIGFLKTCGLHIDLFTFVQRLPASRSKYEYHMEWDSVAALPIATYEHWLNTQISKQARNRIKKAGKLNVEVRQLSFDVELIKGISAIYNDSPIRQGVRCTHYNMEYEMVKKLNGTYLDRADFIGAFFQDDLIGYIKIVYTDGYARTMGIMGKPSQRDKSPMNLLIAKAVQICSEKKVPYLIYGKYDYGKGGSETLKAFKNNNGFENILIPRFYVPLNFFGFIVLKLGLYKRIRDMLPKRLVKVLRNLRQSLFLAIYTVSSKYRRTCDQEKKCPDFSE